MKELFVANKKARKSDGTELIVSYCILAEQLTREDGEPVCECYGVKLTTSHGEQAVARTLTVSLKKIDELVSRLHSNLVLPMELRFVLDDYFAG